MKLLDVFSRKKKEPSHSLQATWQDAPVADNPVEMQRHNTAQVVLLCEVPPEERDEAWQAAFEKYAPGAALELGEPRTLSGQDGFPYLNLVLPASDLAFTSFTMQGANTTFLLDNGLGVAVFARQREPEYIFSYGDILSYRLAGHFNVPAALPEPAAGPSGRSIPQDMRSGQTVFLPPPESLLPSLVRRRIGDFLRPYCEHPQVTLQYRHSADPELFFTCDRSMFGSEEHFSQVLNGIGWFLPRSYAYGAISFAEAVRKDPAMFLAL